MKIKLSVVKGPHQGKSFEFAGHETFLVGRGKKAHFRLRKDDQFFSRTHFMVEVNPPFCRILDLNSRNGTYVNKTPVRITDLSDGDLIQGGQTLIRVSIEETGDDSQKKDVSNPFPLEPITLPPDQVPFSTGSVSSTPSADPLSPQKLSKLLPDDYRQRIEVEPQPIPGFSIVQKLGAGGMGAVYQAIRQRDQKVVAIKTILPQAASSERDRAMFLREAEILENLKHRSIVRFLEMGQAGDMLFFAMEYVAGSDASKLVRSELSPLSIDRACGLVCQLLDALHYAHEEGFVHRDIKPGNIMVTRKRETEIVKVADFGLARLYHSSKLSGLTMTDQMGGTPQFMPPEQVTDYRNVGPAADQYSAAATLYFLLTGKYIFDFPRVSDPGDLATQFLKILYEDPISIDQRRENIPRKLRLVIEKGLAKEPARRFKSVEAMKKALSGFV